MGTMGGMTSLRVRTLGLSKVAKQLEASRSPDPIMRQLSADRGEKRVIHGSDHKYEEAA
jgi:hypothetical protein